MNKSRTSLELWLCAGVFLVVGCLTSPACAQDTKQSGNEQVAPQSTTTEKNAAKVKQTRELSIDEQLQAAASPEDLERFIEKIKSDELAFVAVQRLARPFLLKRDWSAASAVFEKYKPLFPGMEKRFTKINEILAAPEEGLKISNLGPGINTPWDEYHPVLAANDKNIYFGRDRGVQAGGEDVYASVETDGRWNESINIGPPISTRRHEVPLNIAADGNTLLIFGNYPDSHGRGDVFYCPKKGGCWTTPRAYPSPINSEFFESDAMLTADGRAVLFVSSRPGGVGEYHEKGAVFHGNYNGNTDIYVYVTHPDGRFETINLGKIINTPYTELSPFLHPDGKTLYFSSDGHPGLGNLDLFMATRLRDNSWTEWSEPVNLGKEINGPDNDWGYQVATRGDLAYFSVAGRTDSHGGSDIYSIAMPGLARPLPVTVITGKITDPDGRSLAAVVKWNDLTANQEAGKADSNSETGEYFVALPAGHLYSYHAEKEGYFGESEQIDLSASQEYAQYFLDVTLYPLHMLKDGLAKSGEGLRINNIFFDYDKHVLQKESFLELDRWVAFLAGNGELTAEFQGHTDSMGTDEYNQSLSEKRALAVVNYLAAKGIDKKRLNAKGFGESKPVSDNVTEEGRTRNRRVEVVFGKP